ncbi:restriction endonuclease subunit S [Pseudomonas asiatica]|uniref:restriction endonuclease subunit S n=1 Tax=Pseudomonas asiatica TaxID=2219225 RepID=UPI0025A1028A|nr:restriction endonuclease subunit S [Pseudomonas asiatica]WJM52029.1 restriction endonuclease subunit S [Pseudomonas asiatica]
MRIIENVRLGDIAKVISGFAFKSSEFSDEGVPVVKIANIRVGFLDLDGAQRVNPSYLEKLADKYKVKSGDVLISLTGSHITQPNSVVGRVARASESVPACLLNQRAGKVILNDKDRCDLGFLYYYLTLASLRGDIAAMASGAASQANVSPAQVETLSIDLPPRDEQIRVSSILSTYDDLIENNTRRIEILEEMARRLYEEWFVQFRFPGHEGVEFKGSELGPIPEGWDLTTVAETFEILGGGTPSKSEPAYWEDGHINWYSPTDLTRSGTSFMDESSAKITDIGLSRSSAKMFPPYSVMLTSRATIGVVAINTTPATTNQGFITCIPNKQFPLYLLFHWVKNNVDRFISLGTGATFKEITKGVFKGIELVVPPVVLVDDFQRKVTPLMDMILRLQRKNRNLRTQRDLLLPKLISGEIDVSDIPMPT